jgi:hypothetical protein
MWQLVRTASSVDISVLMSLRVMPIVALPVTVTVPALQKCLIFLC